MPVCAVVGVGPGIGLAVARRFAREGFELALLARREAALHDYVHDLRRQEFTAHGYAADAGDPSSLQAAFAQIAAQQSAPAVLVYNASALHQGAPSTLAVADVLADFQVNLLGALTAAQQVIPAMRQQQRGTILFTGGGLALRPTPQYASLALGKASLRNLTLSLAQELAPAGIHVATVTVAGFVQPQTFFDPDLIAEVYWQLHCQSPAEWQSEVLYQQP